MKYLILCCYISCIFSLKSQTPSDDPTWQLIFSDEFNGNTLDESIWYIANEFDNYSKPTSDPGVSLRRNVEVSNGELIISAKKESYSCTNGAWGCNLPNYDYTVGSIYTINQNFYYGYYEARIKFDYMPGHHPAFWLLNHSGSPIYNEIDIAEIVCNQQKKYITSYSNKYDNIYDGNRTMYTQDIITSTHGPGSLDPSVISGGPDDPQLVYVTNYQFYHTYGFEWQPNKMIWYIDGIAVRNTKPNALFNSPMTVILGNGMEGGVEKAALVYTPIYNFPAKVVVDYFKYYQLKGNCQDAITTCNYNFGTHIDETKNTYSLGNCNNVVPPGKNYVFRATNFVELNDGFEVPLGSEFYADADDFCQLSPYNTHNCNYLFEPCNYNFSGYVNDIKETIEISGINCSAIVSPSDNVKLYATESINLKEGVEIPLGSEIEIKTKICP